MAARLGSLLVLAASLAQAEESKPVVIVDHITSSVYLDDRRRGKGNKLGRGEPPRTGKPPVPLVVGLTGSVITFGAICDVVVRRGGLLRQDFGAWKALNQESAVVEVLEVPEEPEGSVRQGSAAVTRLKVSIAMLMGLVVSSAMRRAARKRPVRAAVEATGLPVRATVEATALPERVEANDPLSIELTKKVSVAKREIELPEDTQEIQFAGNDEPHPELEPERAGDSDDETPISKGGEESEEDTSGGLQPGNKGYVYKRKSEYEAKESRTNSSGDLVLERRNSSERYVTPSKRKTEYHRINTETHLVGLVAGLVGAEEEDDESRVRKQPEFHRMNTEPQTPNADDDEKEEREESVDSFVEFERRNSTANKDVGFFRIHTPQVEKTSFYRISTEGSG